MAGLDDVQARRRAARQKGLAQRLVDWRAAVQRWKAAGKPERSQEEVDWIIHECCEPCKHYDDKWKQCKLCGCFCRKKGRAEFNKPRMLTERCPLNPPKWGEGHVHIPHVLRQVQSTAPMDVIYTIAGGYHDKKKLGSKWDNNELRYSLRSLEENFPNLGRVFIVGHKPEWLTNVVHLPAEDTHRRNKDANLIDKVLLACQSGVSQVFLRLSDDQCLLQPWDGRGVWHMGDADGRLGGKWWNRMQRTCDYLKSKDRPTMFYDCHAPAPVDRDTFVKVMSEADYKTTPGMNINSLYFNSIDIPREHMGNRKAAFHRPVSLETLREQTRGKLFLGYSEAGTNRAMKAFLQERFPKPSRFEIAEKKIKVTSEIANGRCSQQIYRRIYSEVAIRRPCRMLVFGCGNDSEMWMRANKGGMVQFIEDNPRWAKKAAGKECGIVVTTYPSKRNVPAADVEPPEELREILQQEWDVVFIDAPRGYNARTPGRELPIRWASRLPCKPLVFLHDYNRHYETLHANRYFGEPLGVVDTTLGIWQLENKPRSTSLNQAWAYWDGACPAWIKLCFETMEKNIPGINILSPTSLSKLYNQHRAEGEPYDINSMLPFQNSANHRSDIVRVWLLKTLGGMWVDADCIVMSDLRVLCHKYMEGKDFVTYKYRDKFSVSALIMSEPHGEVITEYDKLQRAVLRNRRRRLRRRTIGPIVLGKAIENVGVDKVGVIPTELVDPARGGRNRRQLARGALLPECACVMLRAGTGKKRLMWTKEQWLDGSCYLSGTFRKALGL